MKRKITITALALFLLVVIIGGCTTKAPATTSPDGGEKLGIIKQAAIDAGFEVSDDYKAGTGGDLPLVLGGFLMKIQINGYDFEASVLEFEYPNYASSYATGRYDQKSGMTCFNSGRFLAEYVEVDDFTTAGECIELIRKIFEGVEE